MKKKKGFTLIELVVVIAIAVIFMGLVLSLFLSQNKSFNLVQDSTELQNETRLVLTNLEDDIKVAENREINITMSPVELILYKYEKKISPTATELYGYIYNSTDKTIKKCRLSLVSGTYVIASEMATLTSNVKVVDISLEKDEDPVGDSRGDIYKIDLHLVKKEGTQYEESNKETTKITTRN